MISVIGIGDNVVDIYEHEKKMYPGGNALNFSVFAKKLGFKSAYMGMFGDDERGRYVYEVAKKIGIDLSHCRVYKGENGYCKVNLIDGDRVFTETNQGGISKKYSLEMLNWDKDYIEKADIVHTSIFSYIDDNLPELRKIAKFISYDFSDKYTEEKISKIAKYIDCACLSASFESKERLEELANKFHINGCKSVLITGGKNGSVFSYEREWYVQSADFVTPKDTMGAGDSFITTFLTRYIDAMQYAKNFSGAKYGITNIEMYRKCVIQTSLSAASVIAGLNCLTQGSFGFGTSIER